MANSVSQGAATGAMIGSVVPGLGTAAGAVAGGLIGAIPSLIPTAADRENKKRIAELQRMQELGTLGLTEEEKMAVFGAQQAQIQGNIQANLAQSRAAGAAGMGGAGAAQLQAARAAEAQAGLVAKAQRDLETADILRKRELEQELQARIASKSAKSQERAAAVSGALLGGFEAYAEEGALAKITGGTKLSPGEIQNLTNELGTDAATTERILNDLSANPELLNLLSMLG